MVNASEASVEKILRVVGANCFAILGGEKKICLTRAQKIFRVQSQGGGIFLTQLGLEL